MDEEYYQMWCDIDKLKQLLLQARNALNDVGYMSKDGDKVIISLEHWENAMFVRDIIDLSPFLKNE